MSRKAIKTISNREVRYIPEEQRDLVESAEKMIDRPLVFIGKALTNDQKWIMRDIVVVDEKDGAKKVKGLGEAVKYIWQTCVSEVLNVIQKEEDGSITELQSVKGADKDALWNTNMEADIIEVCNHLRELSELDEEEVKTSV